jgi:hypothetical protein
MTGRMRPMLARDANGADNFADDRDDEENGGEEQQDDVLAFLPHVFDNFHGLLHVPDGLLDHEAGQGEGVSEVLVSARPETRSNHLDGVLDLRFNGLGVCRGPP